MIPNAAIEAAADATAQYCPCDNAQGVRCVDCMRDARTAIEAAMPVIREAIAQEIEAERFNDHYTHGSAVRRKAWFNGMLNAARIVRGGTP